VQFQYTLAVIALNLNDPCGQGYRKVMKITNYLPIDDNVTFHALEPPFRCRLLSNIKFFTWLLSCKTIFTQLLSSRNIFIQLLGCKKMLTQLLSE
jgi:hypothetical protein